MRFVGLILIKMYTLRNDVNGQRFLDELTKSGVRFELNFDVPKYYPRTHSIKGFT